MIPDHFTQQLLWLDAGAGGMPCNGIQILDRDAGAPDVAAAAQDALRTIAALNR
jgi:hypothetical protein